MTTLTRTRAEPAHLSPAAAVRAAAWREEALARAARLRADLSGLRTRAQIDPRWSEQAIASEITTPLDEATHLAAVDRMTVAEWWTGSQVEECWRRLRQAEEGIFQIVAGPTVQVRARAAEGHGSGMLAGDDPRLAGLRLLLGEQAPDEERLRTAGLEVLRASHEASDGRHRRMRSFRNQLFVLSAALCASALVLLGIEPLLGVSLIDTGLPAPGGTALVMFFGMVGALFSAVPSLSTAPELSTPFTMIRQQALLKVTAGAWSAVIGLLVVDSGLAAEPAGASTLTGTLIVAALFGAGQEAVTRFADHKADNLLGRG